MREILFRGKRKDNGEWVEGGIRAIWSSGKDRFVICPSKHFEIDGWTDMDEVEVRPETVGQFLGLTITANDKKVFRGDIIKIGKEIFTVDEGIFGTILIGKSGRSYLLSERHLHDEKYGRLLGEIIGNIHDEVK